MNDNYITLTIGKKKNIALIAHDNKKADLIEWCEQNKDILTQHFLCGTGTTARMITDKTGLPVKGYNSGPLGGDQQIGAKIVEGRIDFVVFFSDPLTAQPHDPDVKALLRIAQVYDIPIANNRASADFMIHSEFMNEEYEHEVINFKKNIKEHDKTLVMRCPIASERSMISSPNPQFCVSCTSKVTPRLVLKSQVLREVCRFPFVMRLHQLASIFRRPLRGPRTT